MDQRGPLNASIVEAFDLLPPQLQTAARYMLDRPDDVALLSMREQARRAGVPPATMTRLAKRLGLDGYDSVRELYAGAVRAGTLGLCRQGGRAGRGAGPARRARARGRDGDRAVAPDRGPGRARGARSPGRCGEPPARGAARLLPRPALVPRRRLALPLHAVASRRQDGDAGRCRRHRPRRHPRRRHGGRPAGRQRRALCPRHHRGRALRGGPRRARGGAHRFRRSRRSPRSRATRSWWRPAARPSSIR